MRSALHADLQRLNNGCRSPYVVFIADEPVQSRPDYPWTVEPGMSDPDGGTLKALFSVYPVGSSTPVIDKMAGSTVASGSVSTLVVPAGKLVHGTTYVVRAYGNDGSLTSATWSAGYDRFTVYTSASAPVVSSTTWTAGSWTLASSGTINWTDTAYTYSWKLDNDPWSPYTSATSQALTALDVDRQHTFSVKAKDVRRPQLLRGAIDHARIDDIRRRTDR